ncbi:response regulator [Rhizobium sp. RU36D]|uniref:response regulator n=1 Tax=Rhizobium sp. RU36D TaxID=1907415 RepID=UPI0015C49C16|nr:response regulator [Rhizobium sp. RU36D]
MTNDTTSPDSALQSAMLDALGDALSIAFIVYDKNDQITYSSRNIGSYFHVPSDFLTPGTRLRDFLGALYDRNEASLPARAKTPGAREKWIAEHISAHWRERSDAVERDAGNRLLKFAKRRLPSGYGICVVSDVTEQKKREEQWRADMERVQLTEEILDNLTVPVFVSDSKLSLVAVNKAFCAEQGVGPESLLDQTLAQVFPQHSQSHLVATAQHVVETGSPSTAESIEGGQAYSFSFQRVGKPGRYFLVCNVGAIAEASPAAVAAVREQIPQLNSAAMVAAQSHALGNAADQPLFGRKVLLITSDHDFEAQCLEILARLGVEACSVRDEEEEEALLTIAASIGLQIDLVVVDSQMDIRCIECAEQRGIGVLALDGFELATQLAHRLSQGISGGAEIGIDDWEITTREPDEKPKPSGHLQVLVAEDNQVNQIVFSQILDSLGCTYKIVADGEEVVRQWKALKPRMILMDLTLPGLNGLEACRRIRQLEGDRSETPIIGVLTLAVDRDELDCMAAGMNETILKPLSPDVIAGVLQRYHLEIADHYAV